MSFTGIVHRDNDGTVWFDDHPVRDPSDVPRRKAWRNTLWYAPAGIGSRDWARLMGPDDEAFGPRPGQALGVSFGVGRGKMQIWNAAAWGVNERDPNRCHKALSKIRAQAAAVGLTLRKSVAATALQLYLDRFDGHDERPRFCQLPARWRGMAHAAMHGGPISVLSGGAPYAVQIDVRQAYLDALRQDVPVLGKNTSGEQVGGWYTHGDLRWHKIRMLVGFVDATVEVRLPDGDEGGLPPLPVHLAQGAVFPIGRLRGCWTIAQVREAEERGEVEIVQVHQFCFATQTRPLFAELAELFASFPQPLSKRLYTRFWGKLGSRGGYVGVASEKPREGEVPAGGLWWRFDGVPLDSHKAARHYRPDLAAFVTAHNHRRVFTTLRRLQPGSLVACHVDALWTTDLVESARICSESDEHDIGGWRQKRAGPLRFYGTGCYEHDGHVAASGYDPATYGKLTSESLRKWLRDGRDTQRRLLTEARTWEGDPALTASATSRPLSLEMDVSRSPIEGPSVYDPMWTSSGWPRKSDVVQGEPLSVSAPRYVEAPPH